MAALAEILSWKFNNAEGITVKNGVLTEWPEVLGARPTDQQVATWSVEYDAFVEAEAQGAANLAQAKITAIVENLPSWGQVKTAIENNFTNVGQRKIILGLARIVYLTVKNEYT